MKMTRLATILAVVVVCTAAGSALATEVDCTYAGGTGGCFNAAPSWGILQSPSASGALSNSSFTDGSYTESTYLNGSGVWTYYFRFTSSAPTGFNVTNFRTGAGSGFTEQDNFDPTLFYGEVTDSTTNGGTSCNYAGGNCTFLFEPHFLQVNLGGAGLPSGDMFSFYTQSFNGPGPGTFSAQSLASFDNGNAVDPSSTVPEPLTVVLFLSGLGFVARARHGNTGCKR